MSAPTSFLMWNRSSKGNNSSSQDQSRKSGDEDDRMLDGPPPSLKIPPPPSKFTQTSVYGNNSHEEPIYGVSAHASVGSLHGNPSSSTRRNRRHQFSDEDDVSDVTCDTTFHDSLSSRQRTSSSNHQRMQHYKDLTEPSQGAMANMTMTTSSNSNYHKNKPYSEKSKEAIQMYWGEQMALLKLELATVKAECDRTQWKFGQLLEKKIHADNKIAELEKENLELKQALRASEKKCLILSMSQTYSAGTSSAAPTTTIHYDETITIGSGDGCGQSISGGSSTAAAASRPYRTIHEEEDNDDDDDHDDYYHDGNYNNDEDEDDEDYDDDNVSVGWRQGRRQRRYENRGFGTSTRIDHDMQEEEQESRTTLSGGQGGSVQRANQMFQPLSSSTSSALPPPPPQSSPFGSKQKTTKKKSTTNSSSSVDIVVPRMMMMMNKSDKFHEISIDDMTTPSNQDESKATIHTDPTTLVVLYPEDDPFSTLNPEMDDSNVGKSSSWWSWGGGGGGGGSSGTTGR